MVPVTITVWIVQVLVGYALVYYAGMNAQSFNFSSPVLSPPSVRRSTPSAISTLGFGDITPATGIYQALAVSEVLIGFGILTLAISHVVGVYGVLQQLGVTVAGLLHQASDTAEPLSILAPHFHDGEPRDMESQVVVHHSSLLGLYEGLRCYPIVYYHHSRRAYRSLPYTFRIVGGTAGALRWGLPKGHSARQAPYSPALITGLDMAISFLDKRFLSEDLEKPPAPASFETFRSALEQDAEPENPWRARFSEMQLYMRNLAGIEEPSATEEACDRYKEWLPFAHRNRAFFEASAKDLGYELEDLNYGPGERMF